MRQPRYLSPSALKTFEKSPVEYYLRYLSDQKPPNFPQTQPMAIGSAFDAYVKNFLHERLIGKDPKYELDTLLEMQVESHNRDWSRLHGLHVFTEYKNSGALADLMLELKGSIGNPRFEFEVQANVAESGEFA